VRILHSPVAIPGIDTDWSFKTMPAGGGLFFVLCCSMLVSHTAEPPNRLFDDRRTAHRTAPRKVAGDFLVNARAWAKPGTGGTGAAARVAIELNSWRKELAIFGDRSWRMTALGLMPTQPEPFESMPVTYDRAFGGVGYRANPTGIGWGSGERSRRLPNVERMDQRVTQPTSQPEPAGFGPIDPFWQPRAGKLGTFDEAWLERRWPSLPADSDPSFWNEAPADQQFPDGFRGNERLAFENLDPEHPRLELRLPGRRARAFIAMADGDFRELALALDTIDTDLEAGQTELIWRGGMRINSPRLREIGFLFTLTEKLSQATELADCYARFAAMRRESYPTEEERRADADAARAEHEAAAAKRAQEFNARITAVEAQIADAKQRAEALLQRPGVAAKLDALAKQGPPTDLVATAAPALARLRKQDPAKADEAEVLLRKAEAARKPAAPRLTREQVIEAHAAGTDLSEADLSGLDLSGLELDGARLSRARLTNANLLGASLAGADLSGADLTESDSRNLDLKDARLSGARFTDALLNGARLAGADLSGAQFAGVTAAGLNVDYAHGAGADFAGAKLAGASFRGANLPRGTFTGAALMRALFDNATLAAADFVNVQGGDISFVDADLTNLRAFAADFRGARFTRCRAPQIVLQQAKLDHANFSQAILTRANFAEAELTSAYFDRAVLPNACFDDAILRHAVLTNANLLRASFERTDLAEADFGGANLYQAGFFAARADRTSFAGCFLAGTLLAG
jgi:uncharacterized protein YjbI with pentapeptide repeats